MRHLLLILMENIIPQKVQYWSQNLFKNHILCCLFGGTAPRMYRLAGQYADICLIPPWLPSEKAEEAKQIILKEAKRHDRVAKISFAEIIREAMSDSPQSPPPKYDISSYSKGVERARNSGSEYAIIPVFGPYDAVSNIVNDFGRQIIPSYSSSRSR